MTTTIKKPRKSLAERLEAFEEKMHVLRKKKAEQERRDRERLKLRLGSVAIEAGFTDDWTDAELERVFAAAAKTRNATTKPAMTPPPVKVPPVQPAPTPAR
jgi:hypothetical protein